MLENSPSEVILDPGVRAPERDPTLAPAPAVAVPTHGRAVGLKRLTLYLVGLDAACFTAALLVSYFVRFGLRAMPRDYIVLLCTAPIAWALVFQSFGLYSSWRLSAAEEFRRVVSAASVSCVLMVTASFWFGSNFSRAWVGLTWLLLLVCDLAGRRALRHYVEAAKARGRFTMRTLVVGTGPEAQRLTSSLMDPSLGYQVIGHVAGGDHHIRPKGLPVLGALGQLADLIRSQRADCVFVASNELDSDRMLQVLNTTRQSQAELLVAAGLPELLTTRLSVQTAGGIMMLSLKTPQLTGIQIGIKRAFDLVVATVGLIVTSPLLLGVAAAVKLSSPGPVLFRQQRVTKGGQPFTMFKFRTMLTDGRQLLEERERLSNATAPFFKLGRHDPRLTAIGGYLRRLSLDELPQLFNVVRGEMSLVGPRPLPSDQVAANLDLLAPRHEVPAGMTGWWQVQGRSEVAPDEALRMDLFYVGNWSLTLDLYILAKTFGAVTARRGAF